MTGFSLPSTHPENKAAFFDSGSAARWLSNQPQVNATAMLAALLEQIQAYNAFDTPASDRFKTLEILRKSIFAASGECQSRYENKPLPLLPAEQSILDSVRQLWRTCTVAYLHCLQACLEQDVTIKSHCGKVAHRALSCLRMEQANGYLASTEPDAGFWHTLHAVFAAAERLDVTLERVEDRLLGETSESTVSSQYCMALLLQLSCPFSVSRKHFAAITRWLARWRELAKVDTQADDNPKSCCLALDLSQDRPIHDNLRPAVEARWLLLNGVLRKIRKRVEMLKAGESPDNLKLGSNLSSETCIALLTRTFNQLRHPLQPEPEVSPESETVDVVVGLDNIYQALGGKALKHPKAPSSFSGTLSADRMAIFGHIRDTEVATPIRTEKWWLLKNEVEKLQLQRPADCGNARVIFRGLVAVQLPQSPSYSLALISRLVSRGGTARLRLSVTVDSYRNESVPLVAESREQQTGQTVRYPALLLAADEKRGHLASIILPAGVTARALLIRLYDDQQSLVELRLDELIERNGDYEHWSLRNSAPEATSGRPLP